MTTQIRMNHDEIITIAFSLGKDDPMVPTWLALWEQAKRYDEAVHEMEVHMERMENGLAELKAGRTCTYNLVHLAQEIEKSLVEQKSRKTTFELVAKLSNIEIVA